MATSNNTPTDKPSGTSVKKLRVTLTTIVPYTMAIAGIALIVIAGTYIYSRSQSGSDSAEYSYVIPDEKLDSHLGRQVATDPSPPVEGEPPVPLNIKAPDVAQFANLFPGELLNPKYWSEPEWAGSDPYGGPSIPDEFLPVLSTDLFRDFDPTSNAVRIKIPAISVDSTVVELGIVDLGNQQAYQTPDNTVGHIPETAAPGQQGSGWFFAHLESFVAREGNIFRHLPEIAELIKQDPVDVYLETPDAEFIYRVVGTSQVHQDDLHLSNANDAQITLVTCWPPKIYDQRVLVDATLIAYRLL